LKLELLELPRKSNWLLCGCLYFLDFYRLRNADNKSMWSAKERDCALWLVLFFRSQDIWLCRNAFKFRVQIAECGEILPVVKGVSLRLFPDVTFQALVRI